MFQKELEETVARLTAENHSLRAEVTELRARLSADGAGIAVAQLDAVTAAREQLVNALGALDTVMGRPGSTARTDSCAAPSAQCSRTCNGGRAASPAPNTWPPEASGANHTCCGKTPQAARSSCAQPPGHATASSPPSRTAPEAPTPNAPAAPDRPPAQSDLDPECCFGLFDCSNPLNVPVSDTRGETPATAVLPGGMGTV